MPTINCYVPLTIKLSGRPSEEDWAELERVLIDQYTQALQRSLAALESQGQALPSGPLQEAYDPEREVETGYLLPSYDDGGQKQPVPVQGAGVAEPAAPVGLTQQQVIAMIRSAFPHNGGLPDPDGTHYGYYIALAGEPVRKFYYLDAKGNLASAVLMSSTEKTLIDQRFDPGSYRVELVSGELKGRISRQGRVVLQVINKDNRTLNLVFLVRDLPKPSDAEYEVVVVGKSPYPLFLRVTLIRLSHEQALTTGSTGSYLCSAIIWRRAEDGAEAPIFPLDWLYLRVDIGWEIWRWVPQSGGGDPQRVQLLNIPLGKGNSFLDYNWKDEGDYDIICTARLRDPRASGRSVSDIRRENIILLEKKQATQLALLEAADAAKVDPKDERTWVGSTEELIKRFNAQLATETNEARKRAIQDALNKLNKQLTNSAYAAGPFAIHAIFTERKTSQTRPLTLFVAPASANDEPDSVTWLVIDLTYPSFYETYRGTAANAGAAIRAAFETSRTSFQNKYPPGQILAHVKWDGMDKYGVKEFDFPIETESWQREAFEWLTLGAQALGAITLAAAFVFPPSAFLTGVIVVGVGAGAVVSAITIKSRINAGSWDWDAQGVTDVINIAASITLVGGAVVKGAAANVARTLAAAERLELTAEEVASLGAKAAKLLKFQTAFLLLGLTGDVTNGVIMTVETYKELRDLDAAMAEGVLKDYQRLYGDEEGRRRWERERYARILGILARAAVNGVLIGIALRSNVKGLGELRAAGGTTPQGGGTTALGGVNTGLSTAAQNATTAADYLTALRAESHAAGSPGRKWDYDRFPTPPQGERWRLGDPIDMPNPDGSYPTYDTAQGRYWKNRSHFELEARRTAGTQHDPNSQDPIRRLSDTDLQGIRASGNAPPAPNFPNKVVELEHSGVPQRVRDWLEALGFSKEQSRRLTQVSNPNALLEVRPLEHAFFDAQAWRFGSQRADVQGQRWSGSTAADVRIGRPVAAMDDATVTQILNDARANGYNFNRNPGARNLRDALRSEINVRGLPLAPP